MTLNQTSPPETISLPRRRWRGPGTEGEFEGSYHVGNEGTESLSKCHAPRRCISVGAFFVAAVRIEIFLQRFWLDMSRLHCCERLIAMTFSMCYFFSLYRGCGGKCEKYSSFRDVRVIMLYYFSCLNIECSRLILIETSARENGYIHEWYYY